MVEGSTEASPAVVAPAAALAYTEPVPATPALGLVAAATPVLSPLVRRSAPTPVVIPAAPAVETDQALSSTADAIYEPVATLPSQTTTVREPNGDTVSTTRTVTEEVPLSKLTAGLLQSQAHEGGRSSGSRGVPSSSSSSSSSSTDAQPARGHHGDETTSSKKKEGSADKKSGSSPAASGGSTHKASPKAASTPHPSPSPAPVVSSPPPPAVEQAAELTSVPTPMDLVEAHQQAMQSVGGGRFIINRTALAEVLAGGGGGGVAPAPSVAPPAGGSSSHAVAVAGASAQAKKQPGSSKSPHASAAKSPPSRDKHSHAPPPQEKVQKRHAFRFWLGIWFWLLLLCVCLSIAARRRSGMPLFAPDMFDKAQDGLKWVTAYGATASSTAPAAAGGGGTAAPPGRSASGRHHKSGTRKHHHHKRSDKRAGDEELAPEEYMMTSLRSDRSSVSAPGSSDAGRGAGAQGGGHRSAPSLRAAGGRGAPGGGEGHSPAWEQLYRDAPSVATTHAVDLLKTLTKGAKVNVQRAWVPSDAASPPQLKCGLVADQSGVFLTWQEARFGPSQRVQVYSAHGSVDTLVVSADTSSGAVTLRPGDVEGRAMWVLALNAAFHSHSAAVAAASAGGGGGTWDVGAQELESAVIGLPWHPAVYFAAAGGSAVGGPGASKLRAVHAPPPPAIDDTRLLDAL